MSWRVYGAALMTADISGAKTVSMRVRPNSNQIIKLLSTWCVFYNSPVFTNLYLRIYDDQNSAAGKLIATSTNYYTSAQVYTSAYAIKGLGFEFADIALQSATWYHLVLYATGYTGTDASHIAWVKGWPDNEYRTGLALDFEEIHTSPYRLGAIASPFK